tara:strand:+ start:2306 stop:2620 length:315 start_codon:yes stop_codon:yes gene_type:complete
MSDKETGNDNFPDFKGKPDVEEDGFTTSEIGISIGFILLIAGFILGLIRLMALNGETNQTDFNNNLEQLYLGYLIMFVGILITTVIGFGGMFKRTISSFTSSQE